MKKVGNKLRNSESSSSSGTVLTIATTGTSKSSSSGNSSSLGLKKWKGVAFSGDGCENPFNLDDEDEDQLSTLSSSGEIFCKFF